MSRLVEDRALCEAFRCGERSALTEVYRAYVYDLSAFLCRGFSFTSGSKTYVFSGQLEPWDMECLLQEIFVRAFRPAAREAYDGVRPYRNYLFAIARNLVIDRFRRFENKYVFLEDTAAAQAGSHQTVHVDPERNPEQQAADRELHAQVEEFIASLSAKDRSLFETRFRAGLSVSACAQRLQISEHRVKYSEKLLKKRFFHWMQHRGYFEGYQYERKNLLKFVMVLILAQGASR